MSIIEAIILGIIQGLTEFIPVSSSGHLVIADQLFGSSGNLAFDVALHGGTLLALLIFFRKDIATLARALFSNTPHTKLARMIALATIPAVIFGMLIEDYVEDTLRSSIVVAVNLILVAIAMLVAEHILTKRAKHTKPEHISLREAVTIGFAQALAIIPGMSRSGSTITAGLLVGLDRVAATRFSFLLGVPIISGALVATVFTGGGLEEVQKQPTVFIAGVVAAFVSGLWAIKFLLRYLAKHSLHVFAYYRIALGIIVLILALS